MERTQRLGDVDGVSHSSSRVGDGGAERTEDERIAVAREHLREEVSDGRSDQEFAVTVVVAVGCEFCAVRRLKYQ